MQASTLSEADLDFGRRVGRFLEALGDRRRVVLVSHVNPDPDALAAMAGLSRLLEVERPRVEVVMTVDGMIARAENRLMASLVPIPAVPVAKASITADTAVVMVDSQPCTGRHALDLAPTVVIDHHETGGDLKGVVWADIRSGIGATSTIIANYLFDRGVSIGPRLAAALQYGIESEIAGFPREAGPLDDEALVRLFPLSDKDLIAQIRNPTLPRSHFATFAAALEQAELYGNVVMSWCGPVSQPDIIAELADFFVRFDQVDWALCVGVFDGLLKMSIRCRPLGLHSGEILRAVVDGMGAAGGHDKRAGGAIPLADDAPATVARLLQIVRDRLLRELDVADRRGEPLVGRGRIAAATPFGSP